MSTLILYSACIVAGFFICIIVFSYFHNYYESKRNESIQILQDQVNTNKLMFAEALGSLVEGILLDLRANKLRIEAELQDQLIEVNRQINVSRENNLVENENKLKEVDKAIRISLEKAGKEYKKMEKHFRESVKDDVTLHLITTAYEVVAKALPHRDLVDSQLADAVRAHQRHGDFKVDIDIKDKNPGGGLN